MTEEFKRYIYALDVDTNKKVTQVEFNLKAEDFEGDVNITDLQLQSGNQTTAHVPNTSEMLEQVSFTVDENDFLNTVNNPVKEGVQPRKYENITNRFFNIMGRGSEVIALPNVIHENYKQDLVTSALDLNITAKDDFDVVRISTNYGAHVPERKYSGYEFPTLEDHPLNYKYTREVYFGAGKAGDEITLKASEFSASLNGVKQNLQQGKITLNGHEFENVRQHYMLAPYGTFRIRIEFYREVTETVYWSDEWGEYEKELTYLKDIGVGFYGYAEFNQFTGRAKY